MCSSGCNIADFTHPKDPSLVYPFVRNELDTPENMMKEIVRQYYNGEFQINRNLHILTRTYADLELILSRVISVKILGLYVINWENQIWLKYGNNLRQKRFAVSLRQTIFVYMPVKNIALKNAVYGLRVSDASYHGLPTESKAYQDFRSEFWLG
jgi:hypothetical protein